MGGRSMKDVGGAVLAGSTPLFLGRERAAVNVDVGPERRVYYYEGGELPHNALYLFFSLMGGSWVNW